MPYYTLKVANSILERSFASGKDVSPNRMHALLLLLEAEYSRKTRGRNLLHEASLNVTPGGLVFPSVEWKFGCYRGSYIKRYSRDANDGAFCLATGQDTIFDTVMALVWTGSLGYSDDGLMAATTRGSVWQHALDRGERYVKTVDATQESQYRNMLPEFA